MSALRKLARQWPPILQAKKKTRIGPELHKCPLCTQIIYTGKRSIEAIQVDYPDAIAGRMDIDHINPVVPVESSGKKKDWNDIISRLYCNESNLQSICMFCHKTKSLAERVDRAKARKENKKCE